MGAQIAAHFANAGLEVRLLDVTRDAADAGVKRLRTLKPDPCFVPDVIQRIRTGGFDQDAGLLQDADWIVEAVVESLDVKQTLLSRLAAHVSPDAVVSTNTSGIPIGAIASGLPGALASRWVGTHFFNPPRYLRLLEVIPTPATAAWVVERVSDFADRRLGKGVVVAKDTPGFIANRLGIFGALRSIELVASGDFTIEEVDAMTGPILGRPKSATFRTMDIAGVDILAKVAADLEARLGRAYAVPQLLAAMLERGLFGAKAGQGFYKRATADPGSPILVLDPNTMEYREPAPVRLPALEVAGAIPDTGARVHALLAGQDRVGDFLRRTLGATVAYADEIADEIAHSRDDIDRAMRLGFGWELGPFEIAGGMEAGSLDPARPPGLKARPPADFARSHRVVRSNAGASLVDIGDGVLCVEFHSKLNTLGGDAIAMINEGVTEAEANFSALVIANDADNFSAGANILLVLLEAQEGNWDEIDLMVRAFQGATMRLKTATVPVVAAPAGLALGGGCEVCLHATHVRAAAEAYIGLVEAGVGLLPAGGGTKEMLLRAIDRAGAADPFPFIQAAFETIGFGKVSTSAPDARRLSYLRDADAITMNRARLQEDAKRDALALASAGYQATAPRSAVPVGGPDVLATLTLGIHLAHRAGRITDHERIIGAKVARVLSGGDVPHRTSVGEQALLDLEREGFLSLCGERKTMERMAYTLKTGKTLRN
jgi:3-hydroxyacyl-CoA dehydrogenase